jgi:hypothetical protein
MFGSWNSAFARAANESVMYADPGNDTWSESVPSAAETTATVR